MLVTKYCLRLLSACAAAAITAMAPLSAAAQSNQNGPDLTARERVLDYMTRTSPPAITQPPVIRTDPPQAAAVTTPEVIAPPIEVPPPVTEVPTITEAPAIAEVIPPSAPEIKPPSLTAQEAEDSIVRDLSQASPAPHSNSTPAAVKGFGFYVSAADYLAQRGQQSQPRLTLRYDVTRKNAATGVPGAATTVDIIVGPDYAAISKSAGSLIIYDFKESRLLNVSESTDSFTNTSLYAAAYRAVDTVEKMTEGGTKRVLTPAENVTLESYYLESALGYSAAPAPSDQALTTSENKITATFKGENVFSAAFNGTEFATTRHAYSFVSLLYHSEPVHPSVLAGLRDIKAAPNGMTFRRVGPSVPEGEIISWTLKSKIKETGAFPLPASVTSVIQSENVSPMGFVMSEALAGRALGGRVDPGAALTVIKQTLKDGDKLSAWVSAQTLKDHMGGCERVIGLCRAITQAGQDAGETPELAALIDAMSLLNNKTTRLQGVAALKPMIEAPDAPSLILRRAGLALAKSSRAQRDAAGVNDLNPGDLLSQAIARNPYDLLAYQGLARIKAARGDFVESWDINDALRAFSETSAALRDPINRAEAQLTRRAPGFFPPVGR